MKTSPIGDDEDRLGPEDVIDRDGRVYVTAFGLAHVASVGLRTVRRWIRQAMPAAADDDLFDLRGVEAWLKAQDRMLRMTGAAGRPEIVAARLHILSYLATRPPAPEESDDVSPKEPLVIMRGGKVIARLTELHITMTGGETLIRGRAA